MLNELINAAAEQMAQEFSKTTTLIGHKGLKGTGRETVLMRFLEKYLPEHYAVSSGVVINAQDVQSRQQDIIISNQNQRIQFFKSEDYGFDVLPIESVRGIIEVKSKLTSSELEKSIQNIASVRSMTTDFMSGKRQRFMKPPGFVFAFSSEIQIQRVYDETLTLLNTSDPTTFPTMIVILDRGIVQFRAKNRLDMIELQPSAEAILASIIEEGAGPNLMLFYLTLLSALLQVSEPTEPFPNLVKYAERSGFSQRTASIHRDQAQGSTVMIDGYLFDAQKLQRAYDFLQGKIIDVEDRPLMKQLAQLLNAACHTGNFVKDVENFRPEIVAGDEDN